MSPFRIPSSDRRCRFLELLRALAAAAFVAATLALPAGAESVRTGRFAELPFGISDAHPCPQQGVDARRSGRSKLRAPRSEPRLLWQKAMPFARLLPPTVAADGTLYVAGAEGVVALNGQGDQLWFAPVGPVRHPPAITASGNLVMATGRGELVALNEEGEQHRVPTDFEASATGPVLALANGTVAVGAQDGSVHVLDLHGSRIGRTRAAHGDEADVAQLRSGLLVSVGTDGQLVVFSVNGRVKQNFRSPPAVGNGPVVAEDDSIWVVTTRDVLWRVNADGQPLARTELGQRGVNSPPAVGRDQRLRIGVFRSALGCFEPNGKQRWKVPLDSPIGAVTLDAEDVALATTVRGVMYAVDAQGVILWRAHVRVRGAPRPILGRQGVIYLVSAGGTLDAWR